MQVTQEQLLAICPNLKKNIATELNAVIDKYAIQDVALFIAQLAHESGEFRYTEELASGAAYEGRLDLGNNQPGDGKRYKGRGYIQLTGRSNYQAYKIYSGIDCISNPKIIASPACNLQVAGWFWKTKGINGLTLEQATKRINGGYNGLASRAAYYEKAKQVLSGKDLQMPAPLALPIAQALLPTILNAAPDLLKIFSNKEAPVSERNLEAATKVFEMAKSVTGSNNEQAAADALREPVHAEAFKQAVQDNWYQLQASNIEDVKAAREFYQTHKDVAVLGKFNFVQVLSLIFVFISATGGILALVLDNTSPELRGAIVTLILIGGFTGVKEFWFGSSDGSKQKDSKNAQPQSE